MAVKFLIQVTKEIIAQCKDVGVLDDIDVLGDRCPVKVAIEHIFPNANITNQYIFPFGMEAKERINLPQIAQDFINEFDSLSISPEKRLTLVGIEFEIMIPDEIIEIINIDKISYAIQLREFTEIRQLVVV